MSDKAAACVRNRRTGRRGTTIEHHPLGERLGVGDEKARREEIRNVGSIRRFEWQMEKAKGESQLSGAMTGWSLAAATRRVAAGIAADPGRTDRRRSTPDQGGDRGNSLPTANMAPLAPVRRASSRAFA